jgi:hypothetical protein
MGDHRSSLECADYLVEVVASYPEADNHPPGHGQFEFAQAHRAVQRFGDKIGALLWERFTVHYTPTHGSWLN